jgi:hypothetical protein
LGVGIVQHRDCKASLSKTEQMFEQMFNISLQLCATITFTVVFGD